MSQRYDYLFVKLAVPTIRGMLPPDGGYKEVIEDYARDAWRLVQIIVPPYVWDARYELILERPFVESESSPIDDRIEPHGDSH